MSAGVTNALSAAGAGARIVAAGRNPQGTDIHFDEPVDLLIWVYADSNGSLSLTANAAILPRGGTISHAGPSVTLSEDGLDFTCNYSSVEGQYYSYIAFAFN